MSRIVTQGIPLSVTLSLKRLGRSASIALFSVKMAARVDGRSLWGLATKGVVFTQLTTWRSKSWAKPVEPVKQQQAPLLTIGNETAPLILANGVYSFGVSSGVARLTPTTRRRFADLVAFREAIDKVIPLASNPAGPLAS